MSVYRLAGYKEGCSFEKVEEDKVIFLFSRRNKLNRIIKNFSKNRKYLKVEVNMELFKDVVIFREYLIMLRKEK